MKTLNANDFELEAPAYKNIPVYATESGEVYEADIYLIDGHGLCAKWEDSLSPVFWQSGKNGSGETYEMAEKL